MSHRLDPLLRPRSIAVIGASEREGAVGQLTLKNLQTGRFPGPVYPVNPGRETALGLPCFAGLDALPETADHVVFCLADRHLEQALESAIEHGAKAITLMSQLIVEGDPDFSNRIRQRIIAAGLLACGPNGMGFYNPRDRVWVCGFDTRDNHAPGGNVTLISQSGAGMSGIVDCEERIDFNLAVSTGSEFTVGVADYMDFAIEEHQPRAIGLFLETARDPEGLVAVLDKALQRGIPVVAVKVGRTALSARLAQSHSGAVAGEDAAFNAIFDRYGVQRVSDMHELTTALMIFAQPHPVPAEGGLVTLHDSGGERQLLIDLADEVNTPLTELCDASIAALEQRLDPGLPAVNPLDGWGAGGPDSDRAMADCLAIMMQDPGAAIGAVVHDRAPLSKIYPEYLQYLRAGHAASGKPAVLIANHQGSGADPVAVSITREGFPVVDGLRPFLVAVRALLAWRDARSRAPMRPPHVDKVPVMALKNALTGDEAIGEARALQLLADCGLPCNRTLSANSEAGVREAARQLGFPVVLKSAQSGLHHKSDVQGVHLDLADEADLARAWEDLSARLGPQVIVARMLPPGGTELFLGMIRDQHFGPLVVLGFGGVSLEALNDTVCAVPPFDQAEAHRLLGCLRLNALLTPGRGKPGPDLEAFADCAARFSVIVEQLGDVISELDLNPILVHESGCLAVDALILPAPSGAPADLDSSTDRRAS